MMKLIIVNILMIKHKYDEIINGQDFNDQQSND